MLLPLLNYYHNLLPYIIIFAETCANTHTDSDNYSSDLELHTSGSPILQSHKRRKLVQHYSLVFDSQLDSESEVNAL